MYSFVNYEVYAWGTFGHKFNDIKCSKLVKINLVYYLHPSHISNINNNYNVEIKEDMHWNLKRFMKLSINYTKNYLIYVNFVCTNELCVNLLISKLITITKRDFFLNKQEFQSY